MKKGVCISICLLLFFVSKFDNIHCMEEQSCVCSRFHYEEQLLHKMVKMEIKMEAMESENEEVKKRMELLSEKHENKDLIVNSQGDNQVAFTVYLDKKLDGLTKGQSIPFNQVLTDVGNNYNISSGHYVVPKSGTYFFTWHTEVTGTKKLTTCLAVDGACKVHAYANAKMETTGDIQGAGNSAVLRLFENQEVWIGVYAGTSIYSNTEYRWFYPAFSGFSLF